MAGTRRATEMNLELYAVDHVSETAKNAEKLTEK